jgi:hypothetical protein
MGNCTVECCHKEDAIKSANLGEIRAVLAEGDIKTDRGLERPSSKFPEEKVSLCKKDSS